MFYSESDATSCKLLGQGYVQERLKSSLEVLCLIWGSHQTLKSPPLRMLHDILWHDHIQWQTAVIRHFTKLWPCYRTGPYHRFGRYYLIPRGFHRIFATGAASQQKTLTSPDTWYCGACICSNVETIHSWTCNVFGPFEFRTSLGMSILLSYRVKMHWKSTFVQMLLSILAFNPDYLCCRYI